MITRDKIIKGVIKMKEIKEFEGLLNKACGTKTLNSFLDGLDIDPLYIKKILLGYETSVPGDIVLKKIANGSKGSITYRELTKCFEEEKIKKAFNASMEIRRGQIWYADLGEGVGSEQGGIRPVIILQNNAGNKYAPTVIIAPITSKMKAKLPTHVTIDMESGLSEVSVALLEQIRTIDKQRLLNFVGDCTRENMLKVNKAYKVSGGVVSILDRIEDETNKSQDEELKREYNNFQRIMNSFIGFYKSKMATF